MKKENIFVIMFIIALMLKIYASNEGELKGETRKTTTETKVGQANVDVGDINFDGRFGAGSGKKNKNKNKGGEDRKSAESK